MSAEEQLLLTFERFKEALFDSDVETLREIIAEDYQGFDPQGQPQDLKMILEAYRPGGVKLDRYDVEDLEMRIIGDVGIIIGKGCIRGTYADHEFEHRVRFLDMYIHKRRRLVAMLDASDTIGGCITPYAADGRCRHAACGARGAPARRGGGRGRS